MTDLEQLLSGNVSGELAQRILAEYQAVDPVEAGLRDADEAVDAAVALLADGEDDVERVLLALWIVVDARIKRLRALE